MMGGSLGCGGGEGGGGIKQVGPKGGWDSEAKELGR